MKKMKKVVISMVTILLLASTINVCASGFVTKNISVLYNNIKLVVDGVPVQFGEDTSGKQIEPFVHNGTTYLPIRAIGEALGKEVEWDGKTQTVYVGKKTEFGEETVFVGNGIKEMNFQSNFDYAKFINEYNTQTPIEDNIGSKYINYFLIHNSRPYNRANSYAYVEFPLNGQYKEFKTTLGVPYEYRNYDIPKEVKIYGDDKLIFDKTMNLGFMPEEINIDVTGVLKVKIQVTIPNSYDTSQVGFFNARFIK